MQGLDPPLIVTLETTSKVHRNMSPADPASTRLRASHVLLDLEQFLPYRLSVLSNGSAATSPSYTAIVTVWRSPSGG